MQEETKTAVEEAPGVEEVAQTTETTETTTATESKDDFVPKGRFTQVYAKAKASEREAADLRQRLSVLEANGRPPAHVEEEAAPDPAKYEGREAQYYADVAAFSARQEFKKQTASQAQFQSRQQQAQREQAASTNYLQKVAQEVAKDPGLEFELGELAGIQFHPHTSLLIEESDCAGLLAKHLAKNIDEAKALQALSLTDPLKAAVKIGQLEAKLQGTSQPAKVVKTQAKAIDPVKGGGKTTPGYVPGESSVSDYIRTYYPPPG